MCFDADGRLVPSADARMVITEATRARLRETVASGLERNLGLDAIAEVIETDYAFSEERAARIAEYEWPAPTVRRRWRATGGGRGRIAVRKAWWAEEGCCAVCQTNADAGAIDLEEAFPSGDEATPAHPSCRCVMVPVVDDGESIGKAVDPSKHPRGGVTVGSPVPVVRIGGHAASPSARSRIGSISTTSISGACRGTASPLMQAGTSMGGASSWTGSARGTPTTITDRTAAIENPIQAADFERLRRVLQRGVVRAGEGRTKPQNLPVVTVDHTVRGETYHAVLTVRKRYRTLRLHSFSKRGT